MPVLSAFRLPVFAATSTIVVVGCFGSVALAQSRPDLDALVYGGSTNAQAAQPQPQPPAIVVQQPRQPSPRGLFTSSGASSSGQGGAIAALGGMFKRTPRAVAQPSPIDAQAAMSQPGTSEPASNSSASRNELDTKAYNAPPVATSQPAPAPAENRRGLLTGSKFAPSSGGGAIAALGKGFRGGPRRDAYAPAPVRYAPQPIVLAPSTFDSTYRVDAGDRLRIVVYGQDGLTNTYQIGASGSIIMPLIGGVPARGRTPSELVGAITARLRDGFIREPSVSVEIEAYRPFFILGEVAAPGQYPYVPHMSVESAVAIAGGFSPRAKRDRVTLTHSMPEGLMRAIVPVNTPLNPGDTIMVGERWF